MGDLAETFALMKERKKQSKEKRLEKANPEGWSQHTIYHWYRYINGKKINYYPSTGLVIIGKKRHNINSKYMRNLLGGEQ